MSGMESIDKFFAVCDQLQSCSSIEEVETLKRNLKPSICDEDISTGKSKLKEVTEEGGGEEFQISGNNRKLGKSRIHWVWKSGLLEKLGNLIQSIYDMCRQFRSYSSIEEVETPKRTLKHCTCDNSTGKSKLKEVIGYSEEGGGEEFQISGKNRSPSVDELTKQVDGLIGEVSKLAAPPLPIGSMNNENEIDFESRRSIFNEIMKAIKDGGVGMIGIWGMPGIGKTTLVKRVAKYARDEGFFEEVAMAVVSQKPSVKAIQGQIADKIGLTLTRESEGGRADQLLQTLLARKKPILIILDDIWDRIELNDIGIPSGSQHKGCKVILTSRIQGVCEQMGTERNFTIDLLSANEALDLFLQMSGVDDRFSEKGRLAEKLSEECGLLPICIVIVARGLLNKHKVSWEDLLNRLHKSDLDRKVRASIELSYDNLNREEEKMFFLLCAMFPEDYNIPVQVLFEYGLGLNLFDIVNNVDEAVVRTQNLALSLKSQCLLLDEGNENFVKMHDVIRDVALAIASEGKHALLVPEKTATSILYDDVKKLPDVLECPQLQILMLYSNQRYFQIHDNFFARMENLIVLDMSFVRFVRLPQSFTALESLRTLRFSYCNFRDVSSIGKLQNLVCLSFYGSYFKVFPREVGELSNLRLLDLSNCECLDVITPRVFENLSKLQALRVGTDIRWSSEWYHEDESLLNSIDLSSDLTILEIWIPNTSMLPDVVLLKNLSKFNLSIGKDGPNWQHIFFSKSRILKLTGLDSDDLLKAGIKMLMKKAQHLVLEDIYGMYVANPPHLDGYLSHLVVKKCRHLHKILHIDSPVMSFFQLKVLELLECPELLVVFSAHASSALRNLEEICIENCHKLEALFQLVDVPLTVGDEMVLFPRLLTLKLVNLPKFTTILRTTSLNISKAEVIFLTTEIKTPCRLHNLKSVMDQQLLTLFPKLKKLELEGIGRLSIGCLSTGGSDHVIKGLEALEELMIKINNGNPLAQGLLSKLRKLELGFIREPIESCERLDRGFQNLTSLNFFSCNGVKSLLTPSAVNCLVQLQELFVSKCEIVESIVGETSGEQNFDGECALKFPCLGNFSIKHCPKLETLFQLDVVFFPQLLTLKLVNLPKLTAISSTTSHNISKAKVKFSTTEIVKPCSLHNLESIMDQQLLTFFPKLKKLELEGIGPLLSTADPLHMIKGLEALEELIIKDNNVKTLAQGLLSKLGKLELGFIREPIESCERLDRWLQNLTSLNLFSCNHVKSLLTPSAVNCLVQLQELLVSKCKIVESIVGETSEEQNFDKVIEFSKLRTLKLYNLRRLANFYNGECALKFPCLSDCIIEDCPKMKTFAAMSREMHEPSCQNFVSEEALFGQQVSFGKLSSLVLERLESMEEIWHRGHPATTVGELINLSVQGCDRLLKLFPSNLLAGLQNLTEVHVRSCKSLEHVFEVEDHPPLSNLQKLLQLYDVSELKQLWWNKNSCESFLPRLQYLTINTCPTLQFIFDPSVVNRLENLTRLDVMNCSSIVEIVAEKPGKKIEFPLLDTLYLENLPHFKVNQSVEFPRADTVSVRLCFNAKSRCFVNVGRDLAGPVRFFQSFVE